MNDRLPSWLCDDEKEYVPVVKRGGFIVKTLKSIGEILSRLQVQRGHEKSRCTPAIVKLFFLVLMLIWLSCSRNNLLMLALGACTLGYLCTWPAKDIWTILRTSLVAGAIATLIFVPAMIMIPSGIANNIRVILKVILSVTMLGIFNHTTQWNHITGAMKKLHIPGVFIFTLDITLKYIVILGNEIKDLLTSMQLRTVGKSEREYDSVGSVLGVTFIRSTQMSKEMYEAMICRGFTDDYGDI